MQYDASIIREFARRLYARAEFIMWWYTLMGMLVGVAVGYVAGAGVPDDDKQLLMLVGVGILGSLIGWAAGNDKAFNLRLQAQLAMCQVQIEENTQAGASRLAG